jgi:methionyl-tRNA synthetase
MSKQYYLTTPIYYVNAAPHIGHAYTTIAADAIRRLKHMQGYDAILTTGTDEHGQKVERAAKAVGKSPQEFTDLISAEFRKQWETFGLAVDRFKRTSDPAHHEVVKDLFLRCLKNGYIEKGSYTGQYCVFDELYVNEAGPGDPCPDCGRPTETVTEENYFFKLSAFRDRLLDLYRTQPDFIRPETRRNEVLAFVERGLNDLSISRTTIKWGIPVPAEGNHVFYVWFDALTTYMSAVAGENRWPADLHLIGKEILRFHAVYWPAFLMAADLPLPKQVFAHGWLLFEQDKMSKSKGNIVRATPIQQVMGADALRYFLLREIVFGQDGNFSYDALVNRYNSDLANGLGNLASRTLTMIRQYREGAVPASGGSPEIAALAAQTIGSVAAAFDNLEFSKGLEALWALLAAADKYIVEQAPWALAAKKEEPSIAKLDETLYTAAEVLRIACILLYPVIPGSTEKIWEQLGMREPLASIQSEGLRWGQLSTGQVIGTVAPVFPRVDAKVAIARMRALEEEEAARQAALLGKGGPKPEPATAGDAITIDEFAKVVMKVGLVLSAERVKGADKLLHMQVDIGEAEPRSIVAGIAEAYTPEEMTGRKVVIVANLQPRKLRGLVSNGMVLAASPEGGKPVLVSVAGDVAVGTKLR